MTYRGYTILIGDVIEQLATMPESSVHCCVTSPPYWGLRDYGVDGQIGMEATPEEFIAKMVAVFRAVRRVLREDGTLWLNLGDCYNGIGGPGKQDGGPIGPTAATAIENTRGRRAVGSKPKDLMLMPWRVALALQEDGWWVRSAICWAKKSPMPESVSDRPTSSWEPIFLMSKSARYFYDAEAVKEPLSTGDNGSRFDSERKLTVHPNTGRNRMPPIGGVKHAGNNGNATYSGDRPDWPAKRNQRNVWHLGPEPFNGWTESVHWERVEAGAVGGDIRRTESEDCPVHGCRGSGQCGERAGGSLTRTGGTYSHPDPAQTSAPSSSLQNPGSSGAACSSGSTPPSHSEPATPRSKRSHKTVPAAETNLPCTPCVQTPSGTPDTSTSPEPSCLAGHMHASSSEAGSSSRVQATSGDQTKSRSVGTCTCQYHRRVTEKTSHFAAFPTEIPRRAILAGTSEKGCCAACGAPWVRKVTSKFVEQQDTVKLAKASNKGMDSSNGWGDVPRGTVASKTTGWGPGCGCGSGVVPCTVLDPFLGSGTTLAVARQLGRVGVGVELNPEYVKLAHDRIGKAERPHSHRTDKAEVGGLFA